MRYHAQTAADVSHRRCSLDSLESSSSGTLQNFFVFFLPVKTVDAQAADQAIFGR